MQKVKAELAEEKEEQADLCQELAEEKKEELAEEEVEELFEEVDLAVAEAAVGQAAAVKQEVRGAKRETTSASSDSPTLRRRMCSSFRRVAALTVTTTLSACTRVGALAVVTTHSASRIFTALNVYMFCFLKLLKGKNMYIYLKP